MKDKITNQWFFRDQLLFKALLIFVKEISFLLPLVVLVRLSYTLSLKIGLFFTGAYVSVRYMGEIIYWLGQQFSDRKYRPNDFGFKNLDNNAVYILYQTSATCGVVLGTALIYV